MVHRYGPSCTDGTAVVLRKSAAGQRFLIKDASLGWNPSSPARPKNPVNRLAALGFYPQSVIHGDDHGPHMWTMQPRPGTGICEPRMPGHSAAFLPDRHGNPRHNHEAWVYALKYRPCALRGSTTPNSSSRSCFSSQRRPFANCLRSFRYGPTGSWRARRSVSSNCFLIGGTASDDCFIGVYRVVKC